MLGCPRLVVAAAISALTGIGHGAAIPAPHPTRTPADTESGIDAPKGWPGMPCRIAVTLPNALAPANSDDAASSRRSQVISAANNSKHSLSRRLSTGWLSFFP
ncbi:MAG: hypothetical protein M3381_15180 [Actinomycetota bacterium]|nr:hypothetical protein [Actinomycetota bacterium]